MLAALARRQRAGRGGPLLLRAGTLDGALGLEDRRHREERWLLLRLELCTNRGMFVIMTYYYDISL